MKTNKLTKKRFNICYCRFLHETSGIRTGFDRESDSEPNFKLGQTSRKRAFF